MSLCLNDRRNRVHLPSNLDLSSEIDLMAPRQAEREGFSLGFRHGAFYWCLSGPAPGRCQMGNVGYNLSIPSGECPCSESCLNEWFHDDGERKCGGIERYLNKVGCCSPCV